MLENPQKLDEERENYKHWKSRISSVGTSKSNQYGSSSNNNKYGSTSGDTGGSSFKNNKYGSTSSSTNNKENKKNVDSRDYNPNVKRKEIKTNAISDDEDEVDNKKKKMSIITKILKKM